MKWVEEWGGGDIFFILNTPSSHAFLCRLLIFANLTFKNPYFVNPDLGPNCPNRPQSRQLELGEGFKGRVYVDVILKPIWKMIASLVCFTM